MYMNVGPQLARLSESQPHRGRTDGHMEGLLGRDLINCLHTAETTAIAETKPEGVQDHQLLTHEGIRRLPSCMFTATIKNATELEEIVRILSAKHLMLVHWSATA